MELHCSEILSLDCYFSTYCVPGTARSKKRKSDVGPTLHKIKWHSLEIKKHLFFGRKIIRNLDHVLQSRDITLPTKVHTAKASLVAHLVNNQLAVQETWVWSLGQEDPLEKGMTTLSTILAWRIPWTEEPGTLQSMGSQRVGHNWATITFTFKVFPVLMYGCKSWTIKKAGQWSIDAFELWCWRRPLRVSWTARRSNQSILKEVNAEYSLEGLTLKLKLQYFGHLIQRAYSLEKTLMLGKIEGRRRRGQQRMRWLDGIIDSMDMRLNKLW